MIKIICVGKLKEKYWALAIEEYQKRLQKYTKIDLIEVMDEKTDDKVVALRKEKEQILKYINPKDYIITLEIEGKEYDSMFFSKRLDQIQTLNPNLTFIIGGSFGLDQEIKDLSNEKISFSRLTFPHQLFRVMLLEQIYRAYKIQKNESYHK